MNVAAVSSHAGQAIYYSASVTACNSAVNKYLLKIVITIAANCYCS